MRMNGWLEPAAIIGITILMAAAGCEHNVEEQSGNGTEVTYDTVSREVLQPHCGTCHMGGAASGGLNMAGYHSLVNAPSRESFGLDLIEPNDPAKSYLYLKITGDPSIEGARMPQGGMLSQDNIDLVKSWIEAGAPETAASTGAILSAKNAEVSQK